MSAENLARPGAVVCEWPRKKDLVIQNKKMGEVKRKLHPVAELISCRHPHFWYELNHRPSMLEDVYEVVEKWSDAEVLYLISVVPKLGLDTPFKGKRLKCEINKIGVRSGCTCQNITDFFKQEKVAA